MSGPRGFGLKILDAYVAIGGDTSGLDKAVDQSAAKAVAAGGRIESALSPRRVFGALMAASGAAFGIMLTGANQLDAATRRLQADTGMTATEAAKAEHALAGMYRNNLQGFDEIGAAMANVHNDLGLIGDAADAATEKFLKYATATDQDAAGAVTAFDDILDAWGLTAADAGTVMDKLIVSHQKYGGVMTENQATLASLAPQLRALGVDVDGGIALLNLFSASGLDASGALRALNTAVKNLEPGQTFDDLIAQITSIEDPTLRAKKAIEIFGGIGGVAFANVLRPGIRGLSDFAVSNDEATDAMKRAAEESLSWGDKWTLLLHNVGGALADFGTKFGPLLMVAAAFGPKLTTAIGAGLGGLVGLFSTRIPAAIMAAVIPASVAADVLGVTAGTAAGSAFGTAFTAAAAVAAIAVPVTIILAAQGPIADFLGLSGKQTGPAGTWSPKLGGPFRVPEVVVPVEMAPDEAASGEAFRKYLADLPKGVKGLDYSEWKAAGAKAGEAAAGGLGGTRPQIEAAATTAFGGIPAAAAGLTGATRQAIADNMLAAANEIANQRTGIDALIDRVNEARKNKPLTQTQELERLLQARSSKALADELKSPDRARRATAKALATQLDEAIAELKPRPGIMSDVSKSLIAGLEKSTSEELKGFAGWFALQLQGEAARAAAIAALPSIEPGRGGISEFATPAQIAARSAAIRAGINTAGSLVVPSAAIAALLKSALESADPLIKADAKRAGTRVGTAVADGIDDPQSKADARASMVELVRAAVDYLRGDEAQALVANAWHALTSGLTLPLPGLPVPASGGRRLPPGVEIWATGMPYVARDTLAVIHQREAVLTVNQADDWRSGRAGAGAREQHINIEHVEIRDAHDEFSLTQQLQFLASVG